ncbi:FAD:protein FMN transferase [Thiohalorhabdus sp. Cl-TMA]|uniref:FAD:protein FMN transferase n=1 Tax=Thiohalorhabdus methylotrophus TaxID=3242694 RepID=A0ABV4TY18_9GAMM
MSVEEPVLERLGTLWKARFMAMASPCEVLAETGDRELAEELGGIAAAEAWRIERAFSRYRDDNLIARINTSQGASVEVDTETADLLDFADECHRISDGLFDITSGVLRRIWRFGPDAEPPGAEQIAALMPLIGWHRVTWQRPRLVVPAGMEIDLGGIGKEYAVDRTFTLLEERTEVPFLVNFGGDLRANRVRSDESPWTTGIEHPQETRTAVQTLALHRGGLATSGDVRRSFTHHGVVYGHILHPHTGWPVPDGPRSVTVAAPTCTQAGVLSTLAMLHGADAEAFLDDQELAYWSVR